jgi:hypothetical protein
MGRVGCQGQFPVGFVLVGVRDELVEEMAQLPGGGVGEDVTGTVTVEEMPDERHRVAFDQLKFFIGPKVTGSVDLSLGN